ncbi:hypothetical protein AB0A71_42070 [Kitasatospora aureofaciens]
MNEAFLASSPARRAATTGSLAAQAVMTRRAEVFPYPLQEAP